MSEERKNNEMKPEEGKGQEKRVDESWKEQVRRERESAAREPAEGGRGGREIPAPNLMVLVNSLALQAMIYLGAIPNPETDKPTADMVQAKHMIDLLSILEEKTRGNLAEEEDKALKTVLYDLRTRYVSLAALRNPLA